MLEPRAPGMRSVGSTARTMARDKRRMHAELLQCSCSERKQTLLEELAELARMARMLHDDGYDSIVLDRLHREDQQQLELVQQQPVEAVASKSRQKQGRRKRR